jgi:hypothetical protein
MDFTPTGWMARYNPTKPNAPVIRPVVAWNDEGEALVVDESRAKLVRAANFADFVRLDRCSRVVSAVPAQPGWTVKIWEDNDDDSSIFSVPIVAWLVDEEGFLTPISASSDSHLEPSASSQRHEIVAPSG